VKKLNRLNEDQMSLSNAAIFAESLGHRSLGRRPTEWRSITANTHPHLFEAMDAITHDGGGGCHEHYNVPPGWVDALQRMEIVLGRLSPDQRETVAIGECSEVDALVAEVEGLAVAHRFLDAFCIDFAERESVDAV
jgi:hypothetical protein